MNTERVTPQARGAGRAFFRRLEKSDMNTGAVTPMMENARRLGESRRTLPSPRGTMLHDAANATPPDDGRSPPC